MLTIGQNWGKIANYPPQCSTKIGTPVSIPAQLYAEKSNDLAGSISASLREGNPAF